MKEQWIKVKEWWLALSDKERRVLSIGGACLTLFIIYQFIWTPWLNSIDTMRQQIKVKQKTLSWMQAADKAMQKKDHALLNQPKITSPVVLLTTLKSKIKAAGLDSSLIQLKQVNGDAIEIQFQKIAFDSLMSFLLETVKELHVSIVQFKAVEAGMPGMVNINMIIQGSKS